MQEVNVEALASLVLALVPSEVGGAHGCVHRLGLAVEQHLRPLYRDDVVLQPPCLACLEPSQSAHAVDLALLADESHPNDLPSTVRFRVRFVVSLADESHPNDLAPQCAVLQ